VDQVQMLVCPVTRGKGTRVFEDRRQLKLLEAKGFDNGILIMRYEVEH
jgi:uncharacterized protein YbaR (Trm112 family)